VSAVVGGGARQASRKEESAQENRQENVRQKGGCKEKIDPEEEVKKGGREVQEGIHRLIHPMASSNLTIEEAAHRLRQGEVIAYPTEAVYGLGCDPFNHEAVEKLLDMKGRAESAGLILIADGFSRFEEFIGEVGGGDLSRAEATWPGPVTWLFPKSALVPGWISGAHDSVALRVSDHPVCRALCVAFGGALVSTSANRTGAEPARSREAVELAFGPLVAGVVQGELGGLERPSEIRDVRTGEVVRPA
jgi:L-threonylcarbamoyladenylate synthase